MIENNTVLAIVPARGGSKGIKRKNLRTVGGKSLLARSIEAAKLSQFIDRVIVSSEDEEVIGAAKLAGADVPFVRPIELAMDETPGTQPILHALTQLPHYDYIIVLQPTSPLRNEIDIDQCLKFLVAKNAPACVSVSESEISPHWMFNINANHQLQKLLPTALLMRRQDLPITYLLNGAIYAAKTRWFVENKNFIGAETLAFIMPKERALDVDTELDLQLAEIYIKCVPYEIK